MARTHKWYYLRDQEGRSIRGAALKLYEANTDIEALIYSTPVTAAGDFIDQSTWSTNSSGFFDFFIANEFEPSASRMRGRSTGYQADEYFDLHWQASGGTPVPSGVLFNLQLLPQVFTVDENDSTSTVVNKLVSNELAQKWQSHAEGGTDSNPHGYSPVDVTDQTDVSFSKYVNDDTMYHIMDDLNTLLTCGGEAIHVETSGSIVYHYSLYPSAFSASGADANGTYPQKIHHDMIRTRQYPLYQVWDKSINQVIKPVSIKDVDLEHIIVTVADPTIEYHVIILGGVETISHTVI
jgi:hypothetical protein